MKQNIDTHPMCTKFASLHITSFYTIIHCKLNELLHFLLCLQETVVTMKLSVENFRGSNICFFLYFKIPTKVAEDTIGGAVPAGGWPSP